MLRSALQTVSAGICVNRFDDSKDSFDTWRLPGGSYQTICEFGGFCILKTFQTQYQISPWVPMMPISCDNFGGNSYGRADCYNGSPWATQNQTAILMTSWTGRRALVSQISVYSFIRTSSLSPKRQLSTALCTNLPAVSVIGKTNRVLDSAAWTILYAPTWKRWARTFEPPLLSKGTARLVYLSNR